MNFLERRQLRIEFVQRLFQLRHIILFNRLVAGNTQLPPRSNSLCCILQTVANGFTQIIEPVPDQQYSSIHRPRRSPQCVGNPWQPIPVTQPGGPLVPGTRVILESRLPIVTPLSIVRTKFSRLNLEIAVPWNLGFPSIRGTPAPVPSHQTNPEPGPGASSLYSSLIANDRFRIRSPTVPFHIKSEPVLLFLINIYLSNS